MQASFAYEGEFVLGSEYLEIFSLTDNLEMPGWAHAASHSLLIPQHHLPRATSYRVSLLWSPFTASVPISLFNSVSFHLTVFIQSGWREWGVSHMLFVLNGHSWGPVFLQCLSSLLPHFPHLSQMCPQDPFTSSSHLGNTPAHCVE